MADIKIRAKESGGVVTVKTLMSHPMETGSRKDKKTGESIPAHFIKEVKAEHNGKNVLTSYWSGGISKNPYLAFKFRGGGKGDVVKITWTDNQGNSETGESTIR